MRSLFNLLLIVTIVAGCDDVINPKLPTAEAPLVIDAWLYRKAEPQTITISKANTYFDQSDPQAMTGATVIVTDLADLQNPIVFNEESAGKYVWNPIDENDSFGDIGSDYRLDIELNGENFQAYSSLNPVPKVDSITWRLEEGNAFFDDAYFGEFWSRDLSGDGDTYWVKTWKNGEYLSKPAEIIVTYDAGFSPDGNADGCYFIRPIRDGINPFDVDDEGRLISPYELKEGDDADFVYVELTSITPEAWFFLNQLQEQTDREGGFAELFATPLANIEPNITSENSKLNLVGFFCTSAVSGKGRKFTVDAIYENEEGLDGTCD